MDILNNIKNYIIGILSVIGALLAGLFWYETKKNQTEKALTDNIETKTKVNDINNQITKAEDDAKAQENENVSQKDLLDFLNSNKPK